MADFNFHSNHRLLVGASITGFLFLSLLVAVLPAYQLQSVTPVPNQRPLSELERRGLEVYVAEGCVACHTQQVRNIEMDAMWGNRPSVASDYFYSKQRLDVWRQSPSVLGSERTGPDLTNIGNRQPGDTWHLIHLYNPRYVVQASIMPAYAWLFDIVDESEVDAGDTVVPIPDPALQDAGRKVVAKDEALALVAYLKSLKQIDLPADNVPEFIPAQVSEQLQSSDPPDTADGETVQLLPDGRQLYMSTCAACHQAEGTGIPGAFPPLAGSSIVNDEDPSELIDVVLNGYDARQEFGIMPPFRLQLTDLEIAAILTHERSSWGNTAPPVTAEDVELLREKLTSQNE